MRPRTRTRAGRVRRLAPILLAPALLLTGCSAATDADTALVTSDVDPDTPPAFLDTAQQPSDRLTDFDVTRAGVDPDSTRYQGTWDGDRLYLGVTGTSTVVFLAGVPGDASSWTWSSSEGNAVMGFGVHGPADLQYLPEGTADAPQGWFALSDYLIAQR